MSDIRPGAIVGAGMLSVLDTQKIVTPQLGAEMPIWATPNELKEGSLVNSTYKRAVEIIFDVVSMHARTMFSGRRSGNAYFSDKAETEILSAGNLKNMISDKTTQMSYEEMAKQIPPEEIGQFVFGKTTPIMVSSGSVQQRRSIASYLNRTHFQTCDEKIFEPLTPGREAFYMVERIFNFNKPGLGGFQQAGEKEISTFLLIAAGKSTIHFVVWDDYKHYVKMAKNRDVQNFAYKYICMNYDPSKERDRIRIALNTQEAILAWKELREGK